MGRLNVVILLAVALGTAGCAGAAANSKQSAVPGPAFDPESLFDAQAQGYAIKSMHELATTGRGPRRYRLFAGREADGRLCLTEWQGTFANGSGGLLRCHDELEAPALLPYAAWGLDGQRGGPFFFVGLARADAERVAVHVQGQREVELPLRRWDRFSWSGFSGTVTAWPEFLSAYDADGQLLSRIDLTQRITPCSGGCGLDLLEPLIPNLTEEQEGEFRRLALADPAVRHVIGGRRYTVSSVLPWYDCQDRIFAVTTTVKLIDSATVEADWPFVEFDASKDTPPPYWQAIAHFRISGLRELELTVDVETRDVVGIQPGIEGDPRYSRVRIVKPPPQEGIGCNGSSGD
jgi:hypothetical protein